MTTLARTRERIDLGRCSGLSGSRTEEAGDAIGVHRNGYSAREAGTAPITGPELVSERIG
jgi:hypothetical protein